MPTLSGKVCLGCGEVKSLDNFSKDRQKSDGLRSYCKLCMSKQSLVYRTKNAGLLRQKVKQDRAENPEKYRLWSKKYYDTHKDYEKQRSRDYQVKNKNRLLEYQKVWRQKNPKKVAEHNKKSAKFRAEWKKRNPHSSSYYASKRRATLINATPRWLSGKQIDSIKLLYASAKNLSVYHEVPFHVDHIEPLLGKASCGLHVPWNLQILTADHNLKKSNKL